MSKGKHHKKHGRQPVRGSHHSNRQPVIVGLVLAGAALAILGYVGIRQPNIKVYETPLSAVSCQIKEEDGSYQLQVAGDLEGRISDSDDTDRLVRLTVGTVRSQSSGSVQVAVDGFGTGYFIGGDIIATAKHVVQGDDGKIKTVIVTSVSESSGAIGYVVATHNKADIALVRYTGEKGFPGVLIKSSQKGNNLSALVIAEDEQGSTFGNEAIRRLGFSKMGEEGHYNDTFLSIDNFGRPGMSGSALLANGVYAGTLIVDEARMHEISFGIGFNEEGKPVGRPPETAQRQIMKSTNTRALVEMLNHLCKK